MHLLYRNSLFLLFLSSTPLFFGMNYCTWLLDPAQNFPVFQRCPLLWLTPPQSAENKLTAYFLNNYNIMGDKLLLSVLAPNFNINLKFNMWNYKIAMATFLMLQCQYGFKVLKCYKWRCQGIKRRFKKPKHMKEYIKKNSKKYFVYKFRNLRTFMLLMLPCMYNKNIKKNTIVSKLWANLSPMIIN